MVHVGGGSVVSNYRVAQYHIRSREWSNLPTTPVQGFAMASLNGQLVLVGDLGKGANSLTVWDSTRNRWRQPYPAMPNGRLRSAAVGYKHYIIVACGYTEEELKRLRYWMGSAIHGTKHSLFPWVDVQCPQ